MTDELKQYDEDKAVEFIRALLPENLKNKYTDDEILLVIDIIWDYYESKGLTTVTSDSNDDDDKLNIEDMAKYIRRELKKDGEILMDPEDITYIIKGELEYEETLDIFDD